MENKVIEVISLIINKSIEELKEKMNEEGLWDSLNRVEIILALEDEFDISFSQDEIAELKTICKICDSIKEKI